MSSSLSILDSLVTALSSKVPVDTGNMALDPTATAFGSVETLPPDAIFHTKTKYQADTNPSKVNLGIGAYRTDAGKPYVLDVVRKVEAEIVAAPHRVLEYLPIGGDKDFTRLAQELAFGPELVASGKVAGIQSLSGTGALRVLFSFLASVFPDKTVYLSMPTWGNHKKILRHAGLKQNGYRYWDPKSRGLDIDGMLEDIRKAPEGSIILLHACAHNPTGVDPTKEQWKLIAAAMKERKHLPFFDSAYQGFATGSFDDDAFAVRYFAAQGFSYALSYSFAKNMGLYGQRIGCASVVCASTAEAKAVQTQLCAIVRPMYSNPPKHGAEIVKAVLGNAENKAAWFKEVEMMSARIKAMRHALRDKLEALGTPGTWNHITDQIGMFSFTGLTPTHVELMISRHSIYLLSNGRISMAGINTHCVDYVANAMHDVITNPKSKL